MSVVQNPYLPGGCSHYWWQKGFEANMLDCAPDEDHARNRWGEGKDAAFEEMEQCAEQALTDVNRAEPIRE